MFYRGTADFWSKTSLLKMINSPPKISRSTKKYYVRYNFTCFDGCVLRGTLKSTLAFISGSLKKIIKILRVGWLSFCCREVGYGEGEEEEEEEGHQFFFTTGRKERFAQLRGVNNQYWQYILEQMEIRTNGNFSRKSLAIYSRTNGNSVRRKVWVKK